MNKEWKDEWKEEWKDDWNEEWKEDFYIPRVKFIKIGLLPPHNFPKIWYENKRHFSKLSKSNINLISNFKQNLIVRFLSAEQMYKFLHMLCLQRNQAKTILQRKQTKIDANLKNASKCPFCVNLYLFHNP